MLNMTFRAAFMSFLLLLCGEAAMCQTVSEGWQKIDAEGLFTFDLPPGMKRTGMTGVESFLGEYLDGDRRFLFVHEPYSYLSYDSRRSGEMKDYQETETKIGGRKANVRTYFSDESGQRTYLAELHIGDWARSKVELFMSVEGKSSADLAIAKQIFNSVQFTEENGAHHNFTRTPAGRAFQAHSACPCCTLSAGGVFGGGGRLLTWALNMYRPVAPPHLMNLQSKRAG